MSPEPRRNRKKATEPAEQPQPEPGRNEADAPQEQPEPSPSEDKESPEGPSDPSLLDRQATGSIAAGLSTGKVDRPSVALEDAGGPAMGAGEIGDLPIDLDVEGSPVDKALVYAKGLAAFLAAFILPLAAYRPDLEDEGTLALAFVAAVVAGLLVVRVRNRPKL